MGGSLINYQISKEQMLLNAAIVAESRGDYWMAVTYLEAMASLQKVKLERKPITDRKTVKGQMDLKNYFGRCLTRVMDQTGDQIDSIRAKYGNPLTIKSKQE